VEREDRLAEVLGEWYEARDAGHSLDLSELVRAHPDLADELKIHFELLDTVLAGGVSSSSVPEQLGPYRILSELGTGGMGTVYRAEGPNGDVAVKVLHPHLLRSPGFFKRFLREAEIGKKVRHENVVRTLDVDAVSDDERSYHFLVMEHVERQTLRDLLRELDRVPEELCRHIGREVSKALAAIHEAGVVHRDLKPENVLITIDHVVKVMDLGIAHLADQTIQLSKTSAFVGSVLYAAPEQFGKEPPDYRADWYALGLMLYELATGRHPSRANDFASVMRLRLDGEPRRAGVVNPQLSAYLEEVIHALLAKERESRLDSFPDEDSDWWRERAKAMREETNRPIRRVQIPRETALYGRNGDLTKLCNLFDATASGDGRVVLIEGEAGIGKTRLVDEFVRGLGEEVNFLFGSYPPGGAATVTGAFSVAFREHFGDEGLDETLENYLTITPGLIASFAAFLRGDAPPQGAEPLTKASLQTAFAHVTRALAADLPTIVLIDDLHFAPEEGRALFLALALAVAGHRVLLVGTARPGIPEAWTTDLGRLPHAERMTLARLGAKEVGELLIDSFQSERLAEELGFKISMKSDGNPFFVFEILRGLKEEQFITETVDGSWIRTKVIEKIEVPSSVLDLVRARTANLDEHERELLDVAACWGFTFDPTLVAATVSMDTVPALRAFGRIEKRDCLVRSAGRDFTFDHHQLQEALYRDLPVRLREEYHLGLAEVLEGRIHAQDKVAKEVGGALSVDLVQNFLEGGRADRALTYFDAALDHLKHGYLNEHAVVLARRMLDIPNLLGPERRVRTLLRLARRLDLIGPSAERAAAEADEIDVEDGQLRAEAAAVLGGCQLRSARYAEAEATLRRAVANALVAEDRGSEAYAQNLLGILCLHQGRHSEARTHLERSISLKQELGDAYGEATSLGNLGNVLHDQHKLDEARVLHERHAAIARRIGRRDGEAMAAGNLGNVLREQGDLEAARKHCERQLELSREIGYRVYEANATLNLGVIHAAHGRLQQGRSHFERALDLCRETGDRHCEAHCRVNLGNWYRDCGQLEQAISYLESALEMCSVAGYAWIERSVQASLGRVFEWRGQLAESERMYEQALAATEKGVDRASLAEARLRLGSISARRDAEAAAAHLDAALALSRETGAIDTLVLSATRRAALPGGDADAALATFEMHEDRLPLPTRMNARFHLWKLTADNTHLEEAYRLLCFMRDHAPEEYREAMIENVPLHRDIMEAWEEEGERGA
jgi:serine/threonine protein kinase/tetratricopeptide (TPR) repeat protein